MTESLTIELRVPPHIVEAIQDIRGIKHITPILKVMLEQMLWKEDRFAEHYELPKKPNGNSNQSAPPPSSQQQSATPSYPRAKLRDALPEITGDDPGHPFEIKRPDRCVMGEILPAGTLTVLRVNGGNERERWCIKHFNEALERKQGEIS